MITEKAANAAVQPAINNAQSNRCLDVKDNTPMAQLIHACTTMVKNLKVDGSEAQLVPVSGGASAIVQDSMLTDASGVSPHDATMKEIIDVAQASVSGMLNIARNVVRPMVKDVYEMVDEHVSTVVGTPKRHEVLTVYLEDAYNNPAIVGLVERFSETPVAEMQGSSQIFPELDGQQLEDVLMTGVGRIDEDLKTALVDMEAGFLLRAYNSVFRASGDTLYQSLDQAAVTERTRRCVMLLTFFIARKFMSDTPDGVNTSLSSFNARCAVMLEQAGRFMYSTIQKRDKAIADRKLISYFPQPHRTNEKIVVVGEVYNVFLEEGGSPEVLMGACLSGDRALTYGLLISDKERYLSMYERAEKLHKLKAGANKVTGMVEGTQSVLSQYINNLDSEQSDTIIYDKDTLRKRLRECQDECRVTESTECYVYVRDVVCKVFYPHTNACRILQGIDDLCKENPNMQPREAATLMVVDIVAEWVASMIDVERYKGA